MFFPAASLRRIFPRPATGRCCRARHGASHACVGEFQPLDRQYRRDPHRWPVTPIRDAAVQRPMTRRPGAGAIRRSTRLWITGGVGFMHLGAAVVFVSPNVAGRLEMGEAPVINLTLEPSPRFDAPSPPSVASSTADAAAAPPVRPPELHPRETPIAPDSEVPTYLVSTPAPPLPPNSAVLMTKALADPAAGAVSTQASEAGATQGGGGRVLGVAAVSQEDLYAARVIAWVERNKRSPTGSGTGVVTLRFVLDRRGGVRDAQLVRSSGSRLLDRAALDQIRTTQPFPQPGPGTTWRTREFTLNIDYRRR
jgi:protein TonB